MDKPGGAETERPYEHRCRRWLHRQRDVFYRRPFGYSLLCSTLLSMAVILVLAATQWRPWPRFDASLFLIANLLLSFFLGYPIALTILNISFLLMRPGDAERRRAGMKIEITTLILGLAFSAIFIRFDGSGIEFGADWQAQLYNDALHTPIYGASLPTLIAVALLALAAWLLLRLVPAQRMPPLASVLCISALYLGAAICVLWIIQLFGNWSRQTLYLMLLPANCVLIAAKLVRELAAGRCAEADGQAERYEGKPLLKWLSVLLGNCLNWPWMALILALPLAGILLCILTLFGQQPDGVVKAFTETADWSLSKREGPPNLYRDTHYLRTVAAGGHEGLVKPLRMGLRHGHAVVCNRQLLVANAFEQLVEERAPRLHRMLRGAYDRCGYPLAKRIRSPYAADAVYLIMKPAEWLFLITLYLFDAKPENRIALQYLPGGGPT